MNFEKFTYHLKEYLSFSRGEKVGVLFLVSLIILIFTTLLAFSHFSTNQSSIDISKFKKEIAEFEKLSDSIGKKKDSVYNQKQINNEVKKSGFYKDKVKFLVDLNHADSSVLDKLPGIGPVFANGILKYRSLLGGYYSIIQLHEVYGMKPEVVDKIRKQLVIDTSAIIKINLNNADFKAINAHPYISYEQTKVICKCRKSTKLISIRQLQDLNIFTSDELLKLKPYLSFNE